MGKPGILGHFFGPDGTMAWSENAGETRRPVCSGYPRRQQLSPVEIDPPGSMVWGFPSNNEQLATGN